MRALLRLTSLRTVGGAVRARALHASGVRLEAEKTAADATAGDDVPPAEDAAEADAEPVVSELNAAKEEAAQLRDQVLRTLAEMENLRKRTEKDVVAARTFAVQSFAKSLLDVSDNFDRALENVDVEAATAAPDTALPALVNLVDGLGMTSRELEKAFEKNGLVKFGAVGDVFDPNMHECMFMFEDPSKEANTLGQLLKPGFTLKERVLRAAQVGVVKEA